MQILSEAIRTVPDFPKDGILFRDITTLLQDGKLFRQAVDVFAERYEGKDINAIVGIESRGFIFGSALAYRLGTGLVPVRKAGKLPAAVHSETYDLEYGQDTVQIHQDALAPGSRVILIDDLIATGGTMAAAARLLQRFEGVTVEEIASLIELEALDGRKQLGDVPVYSVLTY